MPTPHVSRFLVPPSYIGITLWPFGIYLSTIKYLSNQRLINHEKIHWEQQKEIALVGAIISLITGISLIAAGVLSWWMLLLLLFPFLLFYIEYVVEWFIKLFIFRNKSYNNLGAEREAKTFERDMTYLSKRKRYRWLKYIFKQP
jgi:UPF0716 family protein affecting phage T7 exclusion